VHATMTALSELRRPEEIARLRGRDLADIAPKPMLDAVAAADELLAVKRAESGLDEGPGA
jgi:hypothetical protein